MNRSKRSKPARVKKEEAQKLIFEQHGTSDVQLTALGAGQAYVLRDGRVLFVFEDGKGILYSSRDVVLSLAEELEQASLEPPRHPAEHLLPEARDFPAHVDKLIHDLGPTFGIDPRALDRSEASLDCVEEAVTRTGHQKAIDPRRMPLLVAYVGEVIRLMVGGSWKVLPDGNSSACEPVIVARDGRILQPFAIVLGELRRGKRGSIRGATDGAIRSNLLGGKST